MKRIYGDTSDNNNLATDSISCSYCIAIKNSQIFKRIGKTNQKMKILSKPKGNAEEYGR